MYVYKCHVYIILSLHLPLEGTSIIKGLSIFSKNLKAASKFYVPKGWQEACSVLRTHKYEAPPYEIWLSGWPGTQDLCTPVVIVLHICHRFMYSSWCRWQEGEALQLSVLRWKKVLQEGKFIRGARNGDRGNYVYRFFWCFADRASQYIYLNN